MACYVPSTNSPLYLTPLYAADECFLEHCASVQYYSWRFWSRRFLNTKMSCLLILNWRGVLWYHRLWHQATYFILTDENCAFASMPCKLSCMRFISTLNRSIVWNRHTGFVPFRISASSFCVVYISYAFYVQGWKGTVLVVSHNKDFVTRLAVTSTVIVEGGAVKFLDRPPRASDWAHDAEGQGWKWVFTA